MPFQLRTLHADKGRGVVALKDIDKRTYITEYRYNAIYERKEREAREKEYELNGETESGSYILDVQVPCAIL